MPASRVVWKLDTPQWRASGAEPAVLITHLKIGAIKLETDRTGTNQPDKVGGFEVWIAPTLKDPDDNWYEPGIAGDYFLIHGTEFQQFLRDRFPSRTDSFDDLESTVIYAYLARTNRIPPGSVEAY